MEKEFVPYDRALRLKALDFDEPCFGYYNELGDFNFEFNKTNSNCNKPGMYGRYCTTPTFSQAFRWFREKCKLDSFVRKIIGTDGEKLYCYDIFKIKLSSSYNSYEEAELACLDKLIEIVE